MMSSYKDILGKSVSLTSREVFTAIESTVSEGLLMSQNKPDATQNAFGRPLHRSSKVDISFISGLAANGMRAAAFINDKEIAQNIQPIAQAVRQQIPMVVMAEYCILQQLYQWSDTGVILWIATNVQEAVDFTVIAHRIAELALVPVVIGIQKDVAEKVQEVSLPDIISLMTFLGDPDQKIPSPTPSQQMLFGKNRRRIPNWFNPDVPVLIGAEKNLKDRSHETAAREQFFTTHLSTLTEKVLLQFEKVFERQHRQVKQYEARKADYMLVTTGHLLPNATKALQTKFKKRVGLIHLHQLFPFPTKEVLAWLDKKKAITVFDQSLNFNGNLHLFKEVASLQLPTKLHAAKFGELPPSDLIAEVVQNMLPGGKGKTQFWLNVPFSRQQSAFPKHQVLNQAIRRDYPQSEEASLMQEGSATHGKELQRTLGIPYLAKHYNDKGPVYSRVARFFEDTAALYEQERELLADPFKANPTMPPATAGFASSGREQLPIFLPDKCTACGDCFVYCPHSAIPPLAIELETIIRTGLDSAAGKGIAITQLTPLIKNLAQFGHQEIRQRTEAVAKVSDFLPLAFQELLRKINPEGERLQKIQADFNFLLQEIGDLKVSVTETLYTKQDKIDKDSGSLFTLAIDPNACTACGLCTEVCDFDALQMEARTPERDIEMEKDFDLWSKMPDTAGHTMARLVEEKDYDDMAALLLSRNFYYSMTGGRPGGKSIPQKAMLHWVTSSAEAAVQSRWHENNQKLDELLEKLSKQIQAQLSNALPKEDFQTLLDTLQDAREERVPFESIIEKWSAREQLSLVDKRTLERKTELVQGLKDLKWMYTKGPSGNGRSRLGIILDASLSDLAEFPWNPFTQPVLLNGSGSPQLSRGLIQGHIRHFIDNIKLLRRAELEVKNKYVSKIHDKEIASLQWVQLTDEERGSLPPLLLLAKRSGLIGEAWSELLQLLNEDWPLKIILLDDAAPSVDETKSELISNSSLLFPLIAHGKAYVVRTSMAEPSHFYKGLQKALRNTKPALCWVLAPDQDKHAISSQRWPQLSSLALKTKAYGHFIFDPSIEGDTLPAKIKLDEQSVSTHRNTVTLVYKEYGENRNLDYPMTWADWAFTLKEWRDHFQLLQDDSAEKIFLADYLEQNIGTREGVPVICRVGAEGSLKYYTVSEQLVQCAEASQKASEVLMELSGLKTEFPDKLKKQVKKEMAVKYEEEMRSLQLDYETKIKNLEQEHLQKIKTSLKEKLMQMAKSKSPTQQK